MIAVDVDGRRPPPTPLRPFLNPYGYRFKRVIMIASQVDVYGAKREVLTTAIPGLPKIFPEQWTIPNGPSIFSLQFVARKMYVVDGKFHMFEERTQRLVNVFMVLYDMQPTMRQINGLFGFTDVHEILRNTFIWIAMPSPDYRTDRMGIQDVKRMVVAFWENSMVVDFAYPPIGSEWPWPEYSTDTELPPPEQKWGSETARPLRMKKIQ